MSLMWLVIALVVVLISKWWYRWSNPKCNGKLPPGSMGFPIIGETFKLHEPYGLCEISPFIKKRMLRYGPLFRTRIYGLKAVFSTDMDVNWKILQEENKSFVSSYEDTIAKTLGDNNMLVQRGGFHKHIKQISLGFLGPEGLKRMIIGDMDRITKEHLISKASQGSFDVQTAFSNLIVTVLTEKMISNLEAETKKTLMDGIEAFNFDWCQIYFKLYFWKALFKTFTGRRNAIRVIKDVCTRRQASREKHNDFLDSLLEDSKKDGSLLSQESAENLIFFIMIAAHETTSKAISLAFKFLAENPKVLAELKREHVAILESREDKESGISWEEYRHKMNFTSMVINEVLRFSNVAPVLLRKALKDVEIKGYTIPAGWTVAVVPPMAHFDPTVYENPLEFDPWRWEGKDTRSGSKTFMAFGGGMRQCVGAEFARLQMSIYLHYLVTRYDISVVQNCEVLRLPGIFLPNGLRIRLIPLIPNKKI
uniref:Cytochrome P450 87A3 n=2 Tax=Noccaea caerulescens TaxID=107243 RepID=A0A1J3EZL1_NOCCA